ncbi:hypothetical protein EON63_05090 [archaeon]|nr:MAG: hypothetical protein EON63_05090 [archaeon]
MQQLPATCALVAIHDAARPLVTVEEVGGCSGCSCM